MEKVAFVFSRGLTCQVEPQPGSNTTDTELWDLCSTNAAPSFGCLPNLLLYCPKPSHPTSKLLLRSLTTLSHVSSAVIFWLPLSFTSPRFQLTQEAALRHNLQLKSSPNSLAKVILLLWTLWFYCCCLPGVLVIFNFSSALSPQKQKCKYFFKHWRGNCCDKCKHNNTAYKKKANEFISGCW